MLKQRDLDMQLHAGVCHCRRGFRPGEGAIRRVRNIDPAATDPLQPRAVGAIMYFR
jgi:hypothetical protein